MLQTHEITTQHLTSTQCDILKLMAGRQCEIRGAAVAEVLSVEVTDADTKTWVHKGYGVICLIKDHPGKQYIFKAYNLMTRQEIVSHRITTSFKYIPRTERFHYMTGSKGRMTGLNFIDDAEALMFKEKVEMKKMKWRFPSTHPHPPGLPELNPPLVSLDDVKSYLPSDSQSQQKRVGEDETKSSRFQIRECLTVK